VNIRDAVRQRILDLCETNQMTINKLALECGLTQSTLNSIINTGSNNPTLATVSKICDGLKITVRDFFNDDLFDKVEQEIV
jgi:hypothetical protein